MVTKPQSNPNFVAQSLILAKNHMVTKRIPSKVKHIHRLILAKNHMVTKHCAL